MKTSRARARALLLVAALALLVVPTAALAIHFTDVDPNNVHAPGIEYLADTGITTGCTATEYCPSDPLNRAQMGTFLFRASGHDPATPASVNAAELDGQGPSAYTTSVFSERLSGNVNLDGHDSAANAATVLTIEDLPAGEYVVSGQVLGSAQGTNTDVSRTICRVLVDGSVVSSTVNRLGSDPGQLLQLTFPVAAHVEVDSGTADLQLRCHVEQLTGDAPRIVGNQSRTQVIATRVGDAS